MKISKISFKNIHSLRGEHHIDFLSGPLAESGLFAITGPTGSGKSTLLDVITLALYNKVPRIGAISKSVIDGEGGIMTRNAQDCYAEVEYISNGKSYRSHWSIERNRNNNLNDRKQEIIDVATGDIIESGKSSVPTKNEELIGLSYDQFVKAMVLSQGEFSKLLKSPRDKRNQLLEDITGAKDYRAIGVAVFQKFKNAADATKAQDIRLGEIELIPEEEKKDFISQEATLTKTKIIQKKALDVLKLEIDHQKGIRKHQAILNTNESSQKELLKDLENFKEEEGVLEKHSKYVTHKPLITDFEQKDKELKETTEEFTRHKTNETQVLKDKDSLLDDAAALLGKPVAPENYSIQLEQLRKAVASLKEQETLAITAAKLHEDHIKKMLLEINRDAERIRFNQEPEVFIKMIQPVEDRIEKFLSTTAIGDDDELVKKEALLKAKSSQVSDLKIVFNQYTSESKIKGAKDAELKISIELAKNYQSLLKTLDEELKILETEVDKLTKEEEDRKKYQSLEAHRSLLVDGEECPLCGALDHPFALHKPFFDLKEDALKSKKELLTTKRDLKVSTQTNLDNEQKKSAVLRQDILAINETIKPQIEQLETLCNSLQVEMVQHSDAITALEKTISSELQGIEQVKKAFQLKKLLVNITQITEQWIISSNLKVKKEAERKQLYKGEDIDGKVRTMLNKWTATLQNISNTKQHMTTLKSKIETISKEKETFQKQLHQILETETIESIPKLKAFILQEATAEAIRQKKNVLQLKQERLKAEKENALKEIEHFKKLVTTAEPIATLESKYQKLEEEFGDLSERIGTLKAKLDADRKAKEKQKVLLSTLEALKKEESLWKTMNGLIGDATGKRFSNFVQDLTLEQLIGYTNLRLKELNDRYILDIPTADEADKNDSLKVFDCHQGDARRSINTLSGGETFMVSLAMAFALSDLAAKNVKIESIFIDEGFGTLDPETLNQAITILEKMQNEGDKSIGVISHVEALKERISTQIRLEKTGSGYSTIEII